MWKDSGSGCEVAMRDSRDFVGFRCNSAGSCNWGLVRGCLRIWSEACW